jgi:hypothetical protein
MKEPLKRLNCGDSRMCTALKAGVNEMLSLPNVP